MKAAKRTAKKTAKAAPQDLDPSSLTAAERAALEAILADPSLEPIVRMPGQLARDLLGIGPGIDVAHEIVSAGAWLRANPTRAKKNGSAFLLKWVQRAQERPRRGAAAPASSDVHTGEIDRFLGFWGRKWGEREGKLYVATDHDRAVSAKIITAAREAEREHGISAQDAAAHWVREYLREQQTQAGGVEDKGYPLAWLPGRIGAIGLPKKAAPPVDPTTAPRMPPPPPPPPAETADHVRQVVDAVSGARMGEIAASLGVRSLPRALAERPPRSTTPSPSALDDADPLLAVAKAALEAELPHLLAHASEAARTASDEQKSAEQVRAAIRALRQDHGDAATRTQLMRYVRHQRAIVPPKRLQRFQGDETGTYSAEAARKHKPSPEVQKACDEMLAAIARGEEIGF